MIDPHLLELPDNMFLKIHSENDVLLAMSCTDQLAETLGFLPNDVLLLKLATEEAVVNALEHSTIRENPFVEVKWIVERNELHLAVRQEGSMFLLEQNDSSLYSTRGRGLQIIKHVMDRLWLEQDEDTITLHMVKNLIEA